MVVDSNRQGVLDFPKPRHKGRARLRHGSCSLNEHDCSHDWCQILDGHPWRFGYPWRLRSNQNANRIE
jgi:hypothetical protein